MSDTAAAPTVRCRNGNHWGRSGAASWLPVAGSHCCGLPGLLWSCSSPSDSLAEHRTGFETARRWCLLLPRTLLYLRPADTLALLALRLCARCLHTRPCCRCAHGSLPVNCAVAVRLAAMMLAATTGCAMPDDYRMACLRWPKAATACSLYCLRSQTDSTICVCQPHSAGKQHSIGSRQ